MGRISSLIQRLCEYGDDELLKTARKLYEAPGDAHDYLGASDLTPLCRALEAFERMLPTPGREHQRGCFGQTHEPGAHGIPAHRLGSCGSAAPGGSVSDGTGQPARSLLREGEALAHFADGANAVTYGIEIDELRGEMAQRRLNRVGFGSFFLPARFRCFLNPPYLSVRTEYGSRRLERASSPMGLRLLQKRRPALFTSFPTTGRRPTSAGCCAKTSMICGYIALWGRSSGNSARWCSSEPKSPAGKPPEWQNACSPTCSPPQNIPELDQLPESAYVIPPAAKPVEQFKGDQFQCRRTGRTAQAIQNPSTACLKTVLSTIGNGGRFCR